MKESDIQSEIMTAVGSHKSVAWCMAVTTGKFKVKGGFITIGHYISEEQKRLTGMSDVIGQLKGSGKFFCIEIKKPNEKPTEVQYEFMWLVEKNNGVSGWCSSVEGAIQIITDGNDGIAKALAKEISEAKRLEHTEK